MEHWIASPQKTKQAVVTIADGLNQSLESIEIKDSQCTAAVNVDSSLYPTLHTVDGYSLFGQHTGYINRLFKFLGVWYCGNGKGVYKQSGSSWTAVYEYGDSNNERLWDSAQFFDGSKLFLLDGSLQLMQYDGSNLSTISGAPANSSYLTTYANRFYLANKNDNLLSYSGLRDPGDWSSTDRFTGSGKITVESSDGKLPTGLATFSDHVILFKKNAMFELFGEDSTNFEMKGPVDVGCISDRTILSTKYGLFFLGVDGFYQYLGGSFPQKISDSIKKYIESLNMAYAQHCCAGFDGRFIYLSLVTGSATTPNITLKYDTTKQSWWPLSYVASSYYLDDQTLYFGTVDGKIMKVGGTTYNGSSIPWSIETKPFSDGDETATKAINRIYIVADIEVGSTLSVYYGPGTEGNNWILARTEVNNTGTIRSINIPVIVRTPEIWFRIKIEGSGKAKIHRIIREITSRR